MVWVGMRNSILILFILFTQMGNFMKEIKKSFGASELINVLEKTFTIVCYAVLLYWSFYMLFDYNDFKFYPPGFFGFGIVFYLAIRKASHVLRSGL